jgi:hypothetical protein
MVFMLRKGKENMVFYFRPEWISTFATAIFMKNLLPVLSLGLLLSACYERNSNDPKAVKEEMRQREIVHLTQAQISERAFQIGDTLCFMAAREMEKRIRSSIDSSCLPAFEATQTWLMQLQEAQLSRFSFNPAGLQKIKSKKEKEIFDAVLYNRENQIPITTNLQKDGDKDFIFTKALVLDQGKCASCHQKNPSGLLRGKAGDTLGIWKIRYARRKVVLSFVD